jgi:hypothetical protein
MHIYFWEFIEHTLISSVLIVLCANNDNILEQVIHALVILGNQLVCHLDILLLSILILIRSRSLFGLFLCPQLHSLERFSRAFSLLFDSLSLRVQSQLKVDAKHYFTRNFFVQNRGFLCTRINPHGQFVEFFELLDHGI